MKPNTANSNKPKPLHGAFDSGDGHADNWKSSDGKAPVSNLQTKSAASHKTLAPMNVTAATHTSAITREFADSEPDLHTVVLSLTPQERREFSGLLQRQQIQKARHSFSAFVRMAWPVMEPSTALIWNWHIEHICAHLEAVTRGDIRRLLINIPPGHSKSLLTSVFWPAWVWLQRPGWRIMCGSYSMDLALRDSVKCRELIESHWYQKNISSCVATAG